MAAAGRVGAPRWSWRRRLGRIRRDGSPPGEKHLDELGVRWILSCGRSGFGIEVDRPEPVQELVISRHREHVSGLAELLAAEVLEDATHGSLERPVWLGALACLKPVVHRRATTPVVAGLPDQYAPARARGASASAGAVQGVSHCAISLANPRRDRTPDDPAYPPVNPIDATTATARGGMFSARALQPPHIRPKRDRAWPPRASRPNLKCHASPRMILRPTHGRDHGSATRRRGGGGAVLRPHRESGASRGRRRHPAPAGAPGPAGSLAARRVRPAPLLGRAQSWSRRICRALGTDGPPTQPVTPASACTGTRGPALPAGFPGRADDRPGEPASDQPLAGVHRTRCLGYRTDHNPRHRAIGDLRRARRNVDGRRIKRRLEHSVNRQLHRRRSSSSRGTQSPPLCPRSRCRQRRRPVSAAGQRDGDLAQGPSQ